MTNVDDLLISYHASEVPGLARLYELARRSSIFPARFDPLMFDRLPSDHPHAVRRRTLDGPPDEGPMLEEERRYAEQREKQQWEDAQRVKLASPYYQPPEVVLEPDNPRVDVKLSVCYLQILNKRLVELSRAVDALFGEPCRLQGDFWYPKGGFREWHTNMFDKPGWRLYIVDVDEPNRSYFRIRSPITGQIITQWDEPGTFNFFHIDPEQPMWHCIGSDTNRWSKGYVVPDNWREEVEASQGSTVAGGR
jgi:hypothetical protein